MKLRMVSRNSLFGAKISFLIISFTLLIIAITNENDIWPFLQKNIPVHAEHQVWFVAAIFFGVISPLYWLSLDWHISRIRSGLVSLLLMYCLQIVTEAIVGHYFFTSMIVPTSILYVGYRIIQLINLQSVVYRTAYTPKGKLTRTMLILATLVFWSLIWIRLTFCIFPGILDDFF